LNANRAPRQPELRRDVICCHRPRLEQRDDPSAAGVEQLVSQNFGHTPYRWHPLQLPGHERRFREVPPPACVLLDTQPAICLSGATTGPAQTASFDAAITQNAQRLMEEGRKIFRHATFGSEAFWGDQLRLHHAIVGEKLGGVGPGVSPKMALSLGLKVDAAALPSDVVAQIKAGKVNMDDPASTVLLLRRPSRPS
jgi:hypothetical protein